MSEPCDTKYQVTRGNEQWRLTNGYVYCGYSGWIFCFAIGTETEIERFYTSSKAYKRFVGQAYQRTKRGIFAEIRYNHLMKPYDKRQLGRDPACGRVSFKTGAALTRKDRLKNRNSKVAKNALRRQISENN